MADWNRAIAGPIDADGFHHLLSAAEAGCRRAQSLVGLAYHTGRGVAVDFGRAAAWYQRAAAAADSYAIANLGVMSLLGQGGPANDLDAYIWIQSAVGLGHQSLRPVLGVLEGRITRNCDPAGSDSILASVSPEIPTVHPCSRPACDLSRCEVV